MVYVKLRVCIYRYPTTPSPSSNYEQASKETCANHNLRVENMLGCQIAKQKVRCTREITQQAAFQKGIKIMQPREKVFKCIQPRKVIPNAQVF